MNETAKIKKHVQKVKKEKRGMGMKTKNKISNINLCFARVRSFYAAKGI